MSKTLCVSVIGGRNFPKQQKSNDFTDKFASVQIGEDKQKTTVKTSHPSSVSWGDVLQFPVANLDVTEDIIIVTVYVKWSLSTDFIGEVRLDVKQHIDVARRFATEHWYSFGTGNARVQENPQNNGGEIGLIIGVYEGDMDAEAGIQKRQIRDIDDPFYDNVGADEIYMEANEVAKENKEAVKRIARIAEQARDTGAKTLETLQGQSEQLQQVEDDVEIIHQQISTGEKRLKSIDSCFCCCFAGCCGPNDDAFKKQIKKQTERAQEAEKTRLKARKEAMRERQEMDRASSSNRTTVAKTGPTPKYKVKDEILTQEKEFDKHQEDIDKELDKVSYLVSDMKSIALQMGEELENQNERIDNLDVNTSVEAERIKRAAEKTRKLM